MAEIGTTAKRERGPKTKAQKKMAAGASKRHRDSKKAAGVPRGAKIDTALAVFLFQGVTSARGLRLAKEHMPMLIARLCRRNGWSGEDAERAVAARIERIATRSATQLVTAAASLTVAVS